MNPATLAILELVQLGISILGETVKGNPTNLEQALLDLSRKSIAAYEAQTGKPIDPALLNPIDPIS